MDWSSDPELQQLFVTELNERSATLRDGARAMLEERVTDDLAGAMLREGHTIKGTGRVMGYDAIASAGLMCEEIWRWVQHRDLAPFPALGAALDRLAEVIPRAHTGETTDLSAAMHGVLQTLEGVALPGQLPDPPATALPADDPLHVKVAFDTPTPEPSPGVSPGLTNADVAAPSPSGQLSSDEARDPASAEAAPAEAAEPAERTPTSRRLDLAALLAEDTPTGPVVFDATEDGIATIAEPEPPPPIVLTPAEIEAAAFPVSLSEGFAAGGHSADQDHATDELGGLIGTLETWAAEESVLVNAGGLYRLINGIAAMRIDLEAASERAAILSERVARAEARLAGDAQAVAESAASARRVATDLQQSALSLASAPLRNITNTLPQLVRYLGRKTGRDIGLEIVGDDALVDRQVLDHIGDAIRQLVVNAVVHGIENADERTAMGKPVAGRVSVHATAKGNQLDVVVRDDGGGVDWDRVRRAAFDQDLIIDPEQADPDDLLTLLYSDGFSTIDEPNEIAGDGTGLARVKAVVEELYGTFTFVTTPSEGTAVTLSVPRYRALQRALIVECSGQIWGIPEASIAEIIPIGSAHISVTDDGSRLDWHGEFIPFGDFAEALGLEDGEPPEHVVVLTTPLGGAALSVERVVDSREVAAKELGPLLSGPQTVTGAALLGGDDFVLLVDAGRMAERLRDIADRPRGPVHRVLVVDDSRGVQQVVAGALASSGFATVVAGSVAEALGMLNDYEVAALVVDFSMPRADGVALAHMVRQRYGHLPIVMLSGVANQEDIERAKKAGVDAFFDKGDFRKGALAETLRSLIEAEPDF